MTEFKKIKNKFNKLPPEKRRIIEKNIHKTETFMDNPLIAGIINNLSDYNVNDLKKNLRKIGKNEEDGLFAVMKKEKPQQKTQNTVDFDLKEKTNIQAEKNLYEETDTHKKTVSNHIPPSPIPPKHTSGKVEGIIGSREIILLVVIAGMIGWFFYQSY